MKGNINMQKQKRITLNADKRKVIADVFQNHFEDNSKFKKAWQQAKETYNDMRSLAKTKIDVLVRTHQPQEDVDTIRGMIQKYGSSGGDLYHDNCFYVQNSTPKYETDYNGNKKEYYDDVHIKFGDMDKDFLTSYYRDEMRAKGIDADYDVRLGDNYEKRNPTYYNSESAVNKFLGFGSRNDVSGNLPCTQKMSGKMILNFGLLEHHIVIVESLIPIQQNLSGFKVSKLLKKM